MGLLLSSTTFLVGHFNHLVVILVERRHEIGRIAALRAVFGVVGRRRAAVYRGDIRLVQDGIFAVNGRFVFLAANLRVGDNNFVVVAAAAAR